MGAKILSLFKVLAEASRYGAPLLYGTTGEIITEKSGSLNLGVEGTMAVGAIGGYLLACYANSLLVGVLFSFICAGICGLLFAFLTVTLKANQNVTGLAMTIFGVGVYQLIGQSMKSKGTFPTMSPALVSASADNGLGALKNIPYIGTLFFSYNILIYVAVMVAILAWIYVKKSKAGLRMRAIGENPGAADSVGINVARTKYINIILGSGITGIGGLYMGVIVNNGAWNDSWVNGFGWISVALVIFASWSPAKAIFGSFLFGFLIAMQSKISVLADAFPSILTWMKFIPQEFYQMLPFLITAVVLIITSMRKSKEGVQPQACGINYFREER